MELLLSSLSDAMISVVISELSQRPQLASLMERFRGEAPEKIALQRALAAAYARFSERYPDLSVSFFDEQFLKKDNVVLELSKFLTPNKTPDIAILESLWRGQFGVNVNSSLLDPLQFFLQLLEDEVKSQTLLKPFIDSRSLDKLYDIAYGIRENHKSQEETNKLLQEIRDLIKTSSSNSLFISDTASDLLSHDRIGKRKEALKARSKRLIDKSRTNNNTKSASYYYFYASLDKLSRLEEVLPEAKEVHRTVVEIINNTSDDIGRHDEYRERCRRLKILLCRLSADSVQNLENSSNFDDLQEGWAYVEEKLRVNETKGDMMILQGQRSGYTLNLSCSNNYFFDYNPVSKVLNFTSTNHWFIEGQLEYLFRLHFWVLSIDKKRRIIFGSPVYLSLPIGVLSS